MFRIFFATLLSSLLACLGVQAQSSSGPSLNLVLPRGQGAIMVSFAGEWHPTKLFLYDHGSRPVLQMSRKTPGLELSYILFPNLSGSPTSESCREDVIKPLISRFSGSISAKDSKRGEVSNDDGIRLATAAYTLKGDRTIAAAAGVDLVQRNVFGFFGDEKICAEIHVSRLGYEPSEEPMLQAEVSHMKVQLAYVPTPLDYSAMASIYYRQMQDYAAAAVYYQAALEASSPNLALDNPTQLRLFRFLTDQTAMSYGMSGDLKRSRAVNEAAIAKDPSYPLYYYNLACADAESGNATAAREHLQQAFDRKANVLNGEKMPDPSADDSILKLKKNKEFWSFVQSLPKS